MPRLLFVTGKLAAPALERLLADLSPRAHFEFSIAVMPITVISLAPINWIAARLKIPDAIDKIIVPGMCPGDLAAFQDLPVERGPEDLRDLPEFFGQGRQPPPELAAYDIEIIAEINHCPRLTLVDILRQARRYRQAGANVIDLGCDPGATWTEVDATVRAVRAEGHRVSIDSFNSAEVHAAVRAGAELVLSVNSTNVAEAPDWGCEVVAIPDSTSDMSGLERTVESLVGSGVPHRIDPVLEPIGFGFANSLGRYLEVRRRYPETAMMMGVGNLTELTGVDSVGINVLLAGFCQELGIWSVLTTEVANWCRTSVRELDLARKMLFYASRKGVLPKKLDPNLLLLRDSKVPEHGKQALHELAQGVRDRHFRVFAEEGMLHVINKQMHLEGTDPFFLLSQIMQETELDPAHAFYLGYEMAKALTALTLGKKYVQDQPLHWGFLTQAETPPHV
jgi:dihydropteroate synthase-like protein